MVLVDGVDVEVGENNRVGNLIHEEKAARLPNLEGSRQPQTK